MSKINASDEFKQRIISSMEQHPLENKIYKYRKIIIAFALLAIMVSCGVIYLPSLLNKPGKTVGPSEFQIQERATDEKASYVSVVYLDGYAYSPSEWLSYSLFPVKDKPYV